MKYLSLALVLIMFSIGVLLPLSNVFAFYSSTEAHQLLSTDSKTIPTFFSFGQGIVNSAGNIFVEQEWKLKVKLLVDGIINVRLIWGAGTNSANIRFDNDGNIVFAGQGGGAGVTPIGLEKDGEFFTISYPNFTPTGDVHIQFNIPTGSVGTEIRGTNLDNYLEGSFCLGGNNPYDETFGCPPDTMLDIFFVLNASGEFPPPTADDLIPSSLLDIPFIVTTEDCSQFEISLLSSSTIDGLICAGKKIGFDILTFLFVPTQGLDFFNAQIASFAGVFPFNIFFGFTDTLKTFVESHDITEKTIDFPLLFDDTTVTILSSSTLSGFIGESNKDLIFELQKNIIWLTVMFVMFKTVF